MVKCKNCKHLRTMYEIGKGKEKEYKWCPVISDSPDIECKRNCNYYECMTNADRIRSMTDEELAEWMHETIYNEGESLFLCDETPSNNCSECEKCYLAWLKTEIK